MQPAAHIYLSELYGRSFLVRLLYEGLGRILTVPGACLLWAAFQTAVFAGLCWSRGTLFPDDAPGTITLLQDPTALAYYLLLPLCFVVLYYSLKRFRKWLNGLPDVLEPATQREAHLALLDLARNAFLPASIAKARLGFVLGGLAIFAYNTLTNLFPQTFYGRAAKWNSIDYPLLFALDRLFVLFVWGYALPIWASSAYTQLSVMVRVSRKMAGHGWLRISPYAQDRFGGLSRLQRAASGVGYLTLAAGLFFMAPLLRSMIWGLPLHVGNYIGLGVYLLFASGGALLPVYLLHRILARKRSEMLAFFTEAFDSINSRVAVLVKDNNIQDLGQEQLGRALETVDRLYTQWAALPVWPVSMMFFVKVLVTVISPVAAFVANEIVSNVSL
jgi:hypothetical protein